MTSSPPVVLLTGASGFVGRSVARRLASEGWRVHALRRAGTPVAAPIGVEWHALGEGRDLTRLVQSLRPDLAIHLAAQFVAAHTPAQIEPLIEAQIGFSARLFEALAQTQVRRVISTGTAWEVGGPSGEPVNLYAALKAGVESLLRFYAGAGGWRSMTLRLFDTYGPDDPRGKLITALVRAARGETAPMELSPGEQKLDLVQIDDVAEAYRVAAERLLAEVPVSGTVEVWAVGSGAPVSLREVVDLIGELSGRRDFCRLGARPYRPREVMEPWRGPKLPGWNPRRALREGLQNLLASDR